jgi:predicted nuclease with TOPRIM domain
MEIQEVLNKRNTESIAGNVKQLFEEVYRLQEFCQLQNEAIYNLQNRLNSLEQQLIIQKVQLTGLGPSVKE